MKNLLTLILIIVSISTTTAQGFMFFTPEEVRAEFENDNYNIRTGFTTDSVMFMSIKDTDFEWVLFLAGDDPIVLESHFINETLDGFKLCIKNIDENEKFIRQGEGNWLIMRSSYAIQVKTKMFDYSNLPVLIYTYKTY